MQRVLFGQIRASHASSRLIGSVDEVVLGVLIP
jgi:hypothetical protein